MTNWSITCHGTQTTGLGDAISWSSLDSQQEMNHLISCECRYTNNNLINHSNQRIWTREDKILALHKKILTAQIREEIYYSLINHGLFSEELKGHHKGTKGNRKSIMHWFTNPHGGQNETKNVAMSWIDSEKTYDMASKGG